MLQFHHQRIEEIGEDAGYREGNENRLKIGESSADENDEAHEEGSNHREGHASQGTPESAALKVGWELAGHRRFQELAIRGTEGDEKVEKGWGQSGRMNRSGYDRSFIRRSEYLRGKDPGRNYPSDVEFKS